MSNFLDNMDVIDGNNHVTNVLLQDRNTLALATSIASRIDNEIIPQIDGNHVYNTATDLNLDNTGTEDCSSILSGITDNVGLKSGTYLIDSNCVINAQVVFARGAIFNVTAGHTLTINGQILAGRYTIFSGDGAIVVDETKQDFGYPEWFNDDVIKCYSVFRHVVLGYKTYILNDDLHINKENSCIEGISYQMLATEVCCRLYFASGRIIIGDIEGTVINNYPCNITLKNVYIDSSANLEMISVYGVIRCYLENLYLKSATTACGIIFYKAIGSYVKNVYVQSVGVTGTFFGFYFRDIYGNDLAGERSASVWLENCTYADTAPANGNTIGFYISSGHSDIFMDACEVAGASVGLAIQNQLHGYDIDILISNCDFDSCRSRSVLLDNCTAGMISFSNCYAAMSADGQGAVFMINNCTNNVSINGFQIIMTSNLQIGLQILSAVSALLNGIIITGAGTSFVATDSTKIKGTYLDNGTPVTI